MFPFLAWFFSLLRTGKALVDDCGLTLQTRWRENAPKREKLNFRLPSVAQNVCASVPSSIEETVEEFACCSNRWLKNRCFVRFRNDVHGYECYSSFSNTVYQTQGRLFHPDFQTPGSGWKKVSNNNNNSNSGVMEIGSDKNPIAVLDIASQIINNSWRN